MRHQITEQLRQAQKNENYVIFDPIDYVDNLVALARIQTGITQAELAELINITQAYISKIENQEKVSIKLLNKVKDALKRCPNPK